MIPNSPTMTIPLQTDKDGTIRIGATRVLLELVVHAYYLDETPEGIVDSYPSLTIAEVYSVIAYYLANREDIDAYVRDRDAEVNQILQDMADNMTSESRVFRERLREFKNKSANQSK